MLWEDERYVRLYTRDTIDWISLGWESQALFALVLRKVDRAGLLQLGKHGLRGLAGLLAMPLEVVERAIPPLLEDGCIEIRDSVLIIKNFMEAQEANSSDAHRQREHRARARDVARAKELLAAETIVTKRDASVTKRDELSHAVTDCHALSQAVTPSLAVPPVLSRAVPLKTPAQETAPAVVKPLELEFAEPDPPARRKRTRKPPGLKDDGQSDPRHAPTRERLKAAFLASRGDGYVWSSRDGGALKALLAFAEPDEIVKRFERGLHTKFPACNGVLDLQTNWNAYGHNTRAVDFKNGKAAVRAEDIPREAFQQTGEVPF